MGWVRESGSGRHYDEACDLGALQSPEWIATIRSEMGRENARSERGYVNRLRKHSEYVSLSSDLVMRVPEQRRKAGCWSVMVGVVKQGMQCAIWTPPKDALLEIAARRYGDMKRQ